MKTVYAVAGLIWAIFCCAAEPEAAPPSSLTIMLAGARNAQAISSISFSTRTEIERVQYDKEQDKHIESKSRNEGRVFISNSKYLADYKIWSDLDSPTPSDGNVSAYDGKRYQFLNRNRSTMVLYNTLPFSGFNAIGSPLLKPLGFLFDPFRNAPATWLSARSTTLWEEQAAHYKYIQTTNENGLTTVVLEWASGGGGNRIHFAKELDWYPIYYENFGQVENKEHINISAKVTRHHKLPAADGGFVIIPPGC
jgi:hypothetical protein